MRETGHENIRRTLECSGLFKTSVFFRACLNGGGGPKVGEVTRKNKTRLLAILQPRVLGWCFLRLLLRLQLRSLSRGVPSSHLEKDERLSLGQYVFIQESVTRCVTRCLVSRETVDLIRCTE